MNQTATYNTTDDYVYDVSTVMDNDTYIDPYQVEMAHIILSTVDCFLVLVITIGNSLTIAAICKYKRLQNPSNVMIVFLSVCDLILGVVYTPSKSLFKTWPNIFNGKISCILTMFIAHFSAYIAIFGLSMMSLERAYAVQFPFHYHSHMTIKRAAAASVFAFSICLGLNVPLIIVGKWETVGCFFNLLFPTAYVRTLILGALIMLFMGFVAFLRVLAAELRRRKQVISTDSQQFAWEKKSARKSRLMCIIYASSVFFWTPHILYYFINTFGPPRRRVVLFRSMSILDLCSSAINFLIYGFKNSKFRTAYKQLLGCKVSARNAAELGSCIQSDTMDTMEESN